MIPVDYASHSAHVDDLPEEIIGALQGIEPREAKIPMVSALSGKWLKGPETDPSYWYTSLRETVEFDRAVNTLTSTGHGTFVEVSPHPPLVGGIAGAVGIGTLRREDGGADRLLASFAEAHVHGVPVDWRTILSAAGHTVDLPTYPFQRDRHWLTDEHTAPSRPAAVASPGPRPGPRVPGHRKGRA